MAKDSADALVWKVGRTGYYLCSHCVTHEERTGGDGLSAAYRAAIAHLWRTHSLKRVWLDEHRPDLQQAAQLAFPIAAAHNTHFDR